MERSPVGGPRERGDDFLPLGAEGPLSFGDDKAQVLYLFSAELGFLPGDSIPHLD